MPEGAAGAELGQYRQQTSSVGMRSEHSRISPAVGSAVHRMQNSITSSGFGKIEESAAEKSLACFAESQTNWIVHPASDDHFQLTAVRPSAIDMGCTRFQRSAIAQLMLLWSEGSLAPVEETIRSPIGTVHIVAASFNRASIEPFGSLVCHKVAVRVAEFPDVRWCSDEDSTIMNENALGERQIVGEHGRAIKDSVSVLIDQSQHAMLRVLELNRRLGRVARTVGDVQNPMIVKAHMNGPLHQWRCGDTFELISIRNRERVRFERNSLLTVRVQADAGNGKRDQKAEAGVCGHEIILAEGERTDCDTHYLLSNLSTKNSTCDLYLVFALG